MLLLMLSPYAAHAANPIIRESKLGKRVYCGDPVAMVVDTDGGVAQIEEGSIGLNGTSVTLTLNSKKLSQVHFDNSPEYTMGTTLRLGENSLYPTDFLWEIVHEGEGVCIQSVNKMGYYITEYRGFVKLIHDDDGTEASQLARTFIPVEADTGVAYESFLYQENILVQTIAVILFFLMSLLVLKLQKVQSRI